AGAARDEANAGPAGDLGHCFGGHRRAALVPADGQLDVAVVEGVERGEVALTRHAEGMADTVDAQLIDEDFAAGARAVVGPHVKELPLGCRPRPIDDSRSESTLPAPRAAQG